jgi:Possible Fer4-like domain in RNase L inhibitor, RLI
MINVEPAFRLCACSRARRATKKSRLVQTHTRSHHARLRRVVTIKKIKLRVWLDEHRCSQGFELNYCESPKSRLDEFTAAIRKMPPKKKGAKPGGKDTEESQTRIAIVNADRCKPKKCGQECKKSCPVVKLGKLCIEVGVKSKLAFISEPLCIGTCRTSPYTTIVVASTDRSDRPVLFERLRYMCQEVPLRRYPNYQSAKGFGKEHDASLWT